MVLVRKKTHFRLFFDLDEFALTISAWTLTIASLYSRFSRILFENTHKWEMTASSNQR